MLIGIDYFSRVVWTEVLAGRSASKVTEIMQRWFENERRPVEVITDNGKEFGNSTFKKLCWDYGVEHRVVSVEAHRSNGRVERAIRTIREGVLKAEGKTLEDKLRYTVRKYNETYHLVLGMGYISPFYIINTLIMMYFNT